MRIVAGVCFAALALAACNKSAGKTEAAAADTAVTAAAEKPVPPGIEAAPHVKAGLWEITSEGMPKVRSCVDPEVQGDSAVIANGVDRRDCTRSHWDRIPGGVAFDFACDANGGQITSRGSITGDFQSAYRMEADNSITKGGQSHSRKTVIDARYVGACPGAMKPGDVQINMNGTWFSPPRQAG